MQYNTYGGGIVVSSSPSSDDFTTGGGGGEVSPAASSLSLLRVSITCLPGSTLEENS